MSSYERMETAYYDNSEDPFLGKGEVVCSKCRYSLFTMGIRNGEVNIYTPNHDGVIPTLCPHCLTPLKWENGVVKPNMA